MLYKEKNKKRKHLSVITTHLEKQFMIALFALVVLVEIVNGLDVSQVIV